MLGSGKKMALAAIFLLAALCLFTWLHAGSTDAKAGRMANQMEDVTVKKVALTYDDGPHAVYTEQLLEVLKRHGVKVTFFLLGKSVAQYPQLVQQEQEQGHLLGNHTYSHADISQMSRSSALAEIADTNRAIYDCTGEYPYLLRPPYGEVSKKFEKDCNMLVALWDVDPKDWNCKNADAVVKHVMSHVEENSVILMHDSYASTVEATDRLIPQLQEQGYQFVTLDEILFE